MNLVFARNFDALTALRFGRFDRALTGGSDELFDLPIAGLAQLRAGRVDDARATAAHIEKLNGGDPTRGYLPQLFLARLAEAQGKDAEARAWFERARQNQEVEYYGEIVPNIPAQEALGGYFLRRSAYAQAVSAFNDCLATYPNDPRALFGLATALTAQGNAPAAAAVRERFDAIWKGADTTLTIDAL